MNPTQIARELGYFLGLAVDRLHQKRPGEQSEQLPPQPALACTIVVTPDGNFVGTPPQVCAVLEAILRSGEHQSMEAT